MVEMVRVVRVSTIVPPFHPQCTIFNYVSLLFFTLLTFHALVRYLEQSFRPCTCSLVVLPSGIIITITSYFLSSLYLVKDSDRKDVRLSLVNLPGITYPPTLAVRTHHVSELEHLFLAVHQLELGDSGSSNSCDSSLA